MITGFGYKEQVIGDDATSAFTFDFLITDKEDLKIFVQDNLGNIVEETDGNDTALFSSVEFDSTDGGGTVTLVNPLSNGYVMTMFLANDYPDQPTSFPNARSFTLEALESALDYITVWGQRVAFFAQRSIRLHDLDDVAAFDMRLPLNLSQYAGKILIINATGTGFDVGPTVQDLIAQAVAAALAADVT